MEADEYIELNTLLAKLRVVCLKNIAEIEDENKEINMAWTRREREKNMGLIKSIDKIRKQMPLKFKEHEISIN